MDELEVYGFMNGYKGLIYGDYRLLTSKDFSGSLTKGGTILGTSRQPFKLMRSTVSIRQQLPTTVFYRGDHGT